MINNGVQKTPTTTFSPAELHQTTSWTRSTLWVRRLTRPYSKSLLLTSIALLTGACWTLVHVLLFGFALPPDRARVMLLTLPAVVLVFGLCFRLFGVFRILWPYLSLRDLLCIARGTACATAVLFVVNTFTLTQPRVSHRVILLDGILMLSAVGGFYALLRLLRETPSRMFTPFSAPEPVLIVGAGDSGDSLLREIRRCLAFTVRVVGFIDDDPNKRGWDLRGVPVLGGIAEIQKAALRHSVRRILIALPGAGGEVLREIVTPLLAAGLTVKVLPPIGQLWSTAPLLPQLRDVAIEDLLRRAPVQFDARGVGALLRGRRVLVTGAAGSIGSELCRQILPYQPARLIAFDSAETPLHDLSLDLRAQMDPGNLMRELGDVTDSVRIRDLFEEHAPDIIFHAAALKHVPMCESHPREAIRVNIGGTRVVTRQAIASGSSRFLLISTDKAVNPSSVMGATKRVAELMTQRMVREGGTTRLSCVRFGNVLGSNGSVLRIFRSQLARGGPLTVTHPEMRRYFMTIPEAVELVLQTSILGEGGEVFELDMGQPVRIVDLAEDLIRLSGAVPGRDVKIVFTGIRPGEKLFEELYGSSEQVTTTSHPKILRLKSDPAPRLDKALQLCLDRLGAVDADDDCDITRLRSLMLNLQDIPEKALIA